MTVGRELLERVASGDIAAWQSLLEQLMPGVTRQIRYSRTMRRSFRDLSPACDYVLDVCANVYARLAERDFRNIRLFLTSAEAMEKPSFEAWLHKAIEFEIGDYVRDKYGHTAAKEDADTARLNKRDVASFASELPDEASCGGSPGP